MIEEGGDQRGNENYKDRRFLQRARETMMEKKEEEKRRGRGGRLGDTRWRIPVSSGRCGSWHVEVPRTIVISSIYLSVIMFYMSI